MLLARLILVGAGNVSGAGGAVEVFGTCLVLLYTGPRGGVGWASVSVEKLCVVSGATMVGAY